MPNAVDDTYTDEATEGAVGAFLGAGGISGLVATIRDHMSGLNISMEHVVNYGGPSGKVRCVSCSFSRRRHTRSSLHWLWQILQTTERDLNGGSSIIEAAKNVACSPLPPTPAPLCAKVIANGVTLLASFGSFLVLVGFKVTWVLFCIAESRANKVHLFQLRITHLCYL